MHVDGRAPHKGLYEKSVGLIIGLILPVSILFFFIPEFPILVVAGEKYRESIPILKVTIFFTLLAPFTRQFGTILDSTGNPRLNFYFTLGGAFVNIILNYFFINTYGILGAAYATLTTYLLMFVFTQIVLAKTFNVNTFNIITYGLWYYKEAFRVLLEYVKKFGSRYIFKTNDVH
jgi:lipopolysaccharide exporter